MGETVPDRPGVSTTPTVWIVAASTCPEPLTRGRIKALGMYCSREKCGKLLTFGICPSAPNSSITKELRKEHSFSLLGS